MKHHASCLFSSVVHSIQTESNSKLLEFCLEQHKADPKGLTISNHGGWQSKQMQKGIAYEELSKILDKSIQTVLTKKIEIDGLWININPPNSYNIVHNHPAFHFSGVYYVQVPENSGKILFENPHTFDAFSEIQSYSDDFKYDTSQYYAVDIQGKEGLLLVFPSYLRHGVHINKSELDRISISFNARVIE
tara:strand:- start:81 stop:650 length:570 start_codon:yes stop_codon:yes gene_type:complete